MAKKLDFSEKSSFWSGQHIKKEAEMSFTEGVVQDGFTRWYKVQTGYMEGLQSVT